MIMFLLGAPGSGKGTVSSVLKDQYGFCHISTGDLFRGMMSKNTPLATEVQRIVQSGNLINDELTNKVLRDELSKHDLSKENIVLDGYPRNTNQLAYLNSIAKVDYVIDLVVDQDIILKRLTGRRSCPNCKAIYNIYYKQPKSNGICDRCSTPLMQRSDDNEASVKVRLETYAKLNAPLVEESKKMGIYHLVDNTNLDEAIKTIVNICNIK